MPFPKRYAEAAARWRVKAGFVVIAIFFWLARPTWTSLAAGASIGLCGMALRAWAAGHLAKNERLTTSGPFARVRNPLYLGSLTVGVAFAIGSAHAGVAVLLLSYFLLFFLPVVEEEEAHLTPTAADSASSGGASLSALRATRISFVSRSRSPTLALSALLARVSVCSSHRASRRDARGPRHELTLPRRDPALRPASPLATGNPG